MFCDDRKPTCFILTVVAGAAKTKKLLPPFEHSALLRPVESMLLAYASPSCRMPCLSEACMLFLAATMACRRAYSTEVDSSREGSPLALLDITPFGFGESCTSYLSLRRMHCNKKSPPFKHQVRQVVNHPMQLKLSYLQFLPLSKGIVKK